MRRYVRAGGCLRCWSGECASFGGVPAHLAQTVDSSSTRLYECRFDGHVVTSLTFEGMLEVALLQLPTQVSVALVLRQTCPLVPRYAQYVQAKLAQVAIARVRRSINAVRAVRCSQEVRGTVAFDRKQPLATVVGTTTNEHVDAVHAILSKRFNVVCDAETIEACDDFPL